MEGTIEYSGLTFSELNEFARTHEDIYLPYFVIEYIRFNNNKNEYSIVHSVESAEEELTHGGRRCTLAYIIFHGKIYLTYEDRYDEFLKEFYGTYLKCVIEHTALITENSNIKISKEFCYDVVMNRIEVLIRGLEFKTIVSSYGNNHIELDVYVDNELHDTVVVW